MTSSEKHAKRSYVGGDYRWPACGWIRKWCSIRSPKCPVKVHLSQDYNRVTRCRSSGRTWECCLQTWHNWKIQHWVSSGGGYWREEGQGSIPGVLQMKCVQKVTYTLRQRCRHFVRAHSCWNNGVLCHTNQELTGLGLGGRGQHGQIALAMSTKQVWTADPESSTRSQSSIPERSCHMVDLFGKKTNCSSGIACDFRPLATRKDRPEKKYFSKYKQVGLPSQASSAKQKFQTTSLWLIFETDGKSKMATGWQYQDVSLWVYSNDHWVAVSRCVAMSLFQWPLGGSIKMCRYESIPIVFDPFFWWEEGRYSHTFDHLSSVPSLSLVALFERGEQRVQTFWQWKVWARYQFQCTLLTIWERRNKESEFGGKSHNCDH